MVSEFEARRMPMFQMRAVMNAIVRDEPERKTIIDLIEKDLRATGYPDEQIGPFLTDLMGVSPALPGHDASVQGTRRLRSPFAQGFENSTPETVPPAEVIGFTPRGVVAGPMSVEPPPKPQSGIHPVVTSQSPLTPLTPAPIPAPAPPRPQTSTLVQRRTTVNLSPTPVQPQPAVVVPHPPSQPLQPIRGPINPPLPTQHAQQEPLQPAGQRNLLRHELSFKTSPGAGPGIAPAPLPGQRPTILVADDDKRIRLVFRLRLEEAGYTIIEVGDGQEAWDRIKQGGIALVVLDMKMPGLHGLEVLSRMVDNQINLPVICCSAYDQLESEFVIQTHPRLRYLVKPVAAEALVAATRELLLKK